MKRLRTIWMKSYVYLVPIITCVIYILYVLVGVHGDKSLPWLGKSLGFGDMCKVIVEFSSIVLGIYGFLVPAVIGKKDKFNKTFWENIDIRKFSKDIQRLLTSGIITILLSMILLISDIMSQLICEIIVGALFWMLIFFCCNSIRFINVFISLIIEGHNYDSDNKNDQVSKEQNELKEKLDRKLDSF